MSERTGIFSWGEPDEGDIYSTGEGEIPLSELLEDE